MSTFCPVSDLQFALSLGNVNQTLTVPKNFTIQLDELDILVGEPTRVMITLFVSFPLSNITINLTNADGMLKTKHCPETKICIAYIAGPDVKINDIFIDIDTRIQNVPHVKIHQPINHSGVSQFSTACVKQKILIGDA